MVTSASLSAAASSLQTMAGTLRTGEGELGAAHQAVGAAMAELETCWAGPTTDEIEGWLSTYWQATAGAPAAVGSAAATVEAWATRAGELAARARQLERQLETLAAVSMAGIVDPAMAEARRQAGIGLADLDGDWSQTCRSYSGELEPAMSELDRAATTVAMPIMGRTVVPGGSYLVVMSAMAALADVPIGEVERTGALEAAIAREIDALLASPLGALLYTLLETAGQGDVTEADSHQSGGDLDAAVDPANALSQLKDYQRATGITLDASTVELMAGLLPALAWLMKADDTRNWGDSDDATAMDPTLLAILRDAAVQSYVAAGSDPFGLALDPDEIMPPNPTADDVVRVLIARSGDDAFTLPANPTLSELSRYVNGPPPRPDAFGVSDLIRNFVFDWEQVWGDDANVAGGAVQVLGILPVGKGLRALRLLNGADNVVDATRVLDDAGALADDTVVAALDNPDLLHAIDALDTSLTDVLVGTHSSSRLARNMEAAGHGPRPPGHASHHIVAGGAYANIPEVSESRMILQKFDIDDLDTAENGVYLPYAQHRSTHDREYFVAVRDELLDATSRSDVEDILSSIAERLDQGTFP